MEGERVAALRHGDGSGLGLTFGFEVKFKAFAKVAGFGADDAVLQIVGFGGAAKNLFSDGLFPNVFEPIGQSASPGIEEKLAEPGSFAEESAGGDAFDQFAFVFRG